jgi:hypothetical protein
MEKTLIMALCTNPRCSNSSLEVEDTCATCNQPKELVKYSSEGYLIIDN